LIDEYLSLGKIVGTHGLRGGFKILTEGGVLDQLPSNSPVYFSQDPDFKVYTLQSVSHQKVTIFKLSEITSLEGAKGFVGRNLLIKKDSLPSLNEGEIYEYQLMGLIPVENGSSIQEYQIISVLRNPAHPILEFSNGENSILIPFINRYIGEVNLQKKEIEVIGWKDWFDAI